jgi:uncharacterized DUF497 family protein
MRFEWDPAKAAANLRRHRVSFEEAATVFGDPLARTYEDPDASGDEARNLTFGVSSGGKAVVVVHCERQDRVRIISAREMTRRERQDYEEGNK